MNALLTGAAPAPVPAVMRPRGAGERSGAAEARSGAEFGAALSAVSGAGQRDRGRPEPTRDDGTPSATTVSPTGSASGLVAPTTGTPGAVTSDAATNDDAVTSDAAMTEPVAQSVANVLTPGVSAALAGTGTVTSQAVVGQDPAAGTLATPAATATTGDDATAETPDPTAEAATGTSNTALSNTALSNPVSLVAAMGTAPMAPVTSSSATASAASSTAPAAGVVGTPATAPTGAALASGATAAAQPTAPAGQPAAVAAATAAVAASEQHPAVRHTAAALPGAQSAAAAAATAATPAGHVATAAGTDQGGASLPAGPGTVDAPVVLPVPATTATVSSTPTAAPSAPAMPATAPQPVAQQLARPLFTLAHAGPGEHVLTVQLTPDALGPVTVRAHVTGHGMHVELFAASDAGRDAVRQILPDLRRDSGGSTTLDLSAQNHPADAGADGRDRAAADTAGRDGTGRETDHPAGREARTGPAPSLPSAPTTVRTAGLDVLA
ncbi:hypothetical protein J2Y89_000629 [Curtobacterium herbarum]|uniref:flagellar hook-length control protein FliK n=1 Tax=Curtobacterium herbarum TaxID=150122 RepID=UPI0020A157A4|nr:flagellar hook-length control protein FliK [Curtobacterium herbarum]MCP1501885.1 hypothetical protein [Curtobacterium herbarum]